jgi:hypothetical protein
MEVWERPALGPEPQRSGNESKNPTRFAPPNWVPPKTVAGRLCSRSDHLP